MNVLFYAFYLSPWNTYPVKTLVKMKPQLFKDNKYIFKQWNSQKFIIQNKMVYKPCLIQLLIVGHIKWKNLFTLEDL